jgi:hypothetical protein
MWIIKASYAHGSHIVMWQGEHLRFKTEQEAKVRAESLNAASKDWNTTYMVQIT